MILQPDIEFPPLPDVARLKDQLWVDHKDLRREESGQWIRLHYAGHPFTGCVVHFDAQGHARGLREYVEGTQRGWTVEMNEAGQWLTCQESLLSLAQGAGWKWDEAAGYVSHRWHSHIHSTLLMQELDRFGTLLSSEWLPPPVPPRLADPPYHLLAHVAAVDVCYRDDGTAHVACVVFTPPSHVRGEHVIATYEVEVAEVAPYEPGAFYRRELPCILAVLAEVRQVIDLVVVDGYVYLEQDARGLGAHLFDALEGRVAVIGVAKTSFHGGKHVEVLRGASASPLFVGAVGLAPQVAASWIEALHGSHRLPDVLRRVDALSKGHGFQPS